MGVDSEDEQRASFANHLDYLFAAYPRPDGLPHTLRDVGQSTGLSIGYLALLRHQGVSMLPDRERQERLTTFFGVGAPFFEEPLPPDAPDVLARHRARVAAALRGVHVEVRPFGAPLHLSDGEYVLHALAHAVRLDREEKLHPPPDQPTTPPLPDDLARTDTAAQGSPGDHVTAAATRAPAPWWRRLLPW
jgi:hypothetical protein